MKKYFLFLAVAAMALGMVACSEKDDVLNNNTKRSVKSVSDLIETNWQFTKSDTIDFGTWYGDNDQLVLDFEVNIYFDSNFAHLTFPDDVVLLNVVDDNQGSYTIEEVQEMKYRYTYDNSTRSGALISDFVDESGNSLEFPFTYDNTLDAITLTINIASDTNPNGYEPFVMQFNRVIAQ